MPKNHNYHTYREDDIVRTLFYVGKDDSRTLEEFRERTKLAEAGVEARKSTRYNDVSIYSEKKYFDDIDRAQREHGDGYDNSSGANNRRGIPLTPNKDVHLMNKVLTSKTNLC